MALLLIVGSFLLSFVEGERSSVANGLGYPGDTLRVVATADTETMPFVGPARLTAAVSTFVTEQRMSVAYSPSNFPDVITLLDEDARFAIADPRLQAELIPGDGRRAALVSTRVAEGNRPLLVPDGVALAGLFTPAVAFDSFYPAVLLDSESAPFASGIYLFAGATIHDPGPTIDLFARNGMQVQDASVYEALTLQNALVSTYGVFVLVLAGVAAAAALLTVHIHAALGRPHLIAAAVLGATRAELRWLVMRRVAPQVLAGTGVGAAAYLAGVLAARAVLLTPSPVAALALLTAVGVCAAAWLAILTWVSAWETRRCCRAVTC